MTVKEAPAGIKVGSFVFEQGAPKVLTGVSQHISQEPLEHQKMM
jgi:hypothetical protein